MTPCPECEGLGWFYDGNGPSAREYACSECDGSGEGHDDTLESFVEVAAKVGLRRAA